MPRHRPLPDDLSLREFAVSDALKSGVSASRLRGPDLSAPFHGVRAPARSLGRTSQPPPDTATSTSPSLEPGLIERCRAYATRMRPGQFFSHSTAARLWGVPLPTPFHSDEPLHVSAWAPRRPPHTRGVVGHELRSANGAAVLRFALPVANPESTWVQLAGMLPLAELIVAGDHLVLNPYLFEPADPRPFTSISALNAQLEGYRGRGTRTGLLALKRVRTGAESRPETLLRLLLVDAGLPEPRLNQNVHDGAGRFLGRVDMLYPDWRVIVEYDGDQHRTSTRQYERDQTRLDALRRDGWTVIQVRSRGLFVNSDTTVARVRRALLEAGWHPTQ